MTDTGHTCLGPVNLNSWLKEAYLKHTTQENATLILLIMKITSIHNCSPVSLNSMSEGWGKGRKMIRGGNPTLITLTWLTHRESDS